MKQKYHRLISFQDEFGVKETFPEGQLVKMAKKSIGILEMTDEEFWEGMGSYFVQLTENLGFFNLIQHLGRELRDFFLNLDNLHDYLKFKFPRLKPPSFFVEDETEGSKSIKINCSIFQVSCHPFFK